MDHILFLGKAFSELELLKLWKGLYLCMWHCDKPLLQVGAFHESDWIECSICMFVFLGGAG